jgi:Protein of unknown function (DUF2939)
MNRLFVRMLGLLAGIILVAATWLYFSPYITVRHIRASIARHDANALSRDIDFPTLRANLKEQLHFLVMNESIKSNVKTHDFLSLREAVLAGLVDAYVTPTGIDRLPAAPQDLFGLDCASCAYDSLSQFSVTIKKADDAKLILTRSGLRWRVTNLWIVDPVTSTLKRLPIPGTPTATP